MVTAELVDVYSYSHRLACLVRTKLAQTREKQQVNGSMDFDDWALILPPSDRRKVVQSISPSGVPITDVLLEGFETQPTNANGGFYGPKAVGENYGRLLQAHPPYVDPMSSLAGGYMVNFSSYRKGGWNPDLPVPPELSQVIQKYQLQSGIGAGQHFCQDLQIGLDIGWGGLLEKVQHYRTVNQSKGAFYDGLEAIVRGMQAWIGHNAAHARQLAAGQGNAQLRQNLLEMAEINERLVTAPPKTFREACQWMLWFDMSARMFNGSGSLGRLDVLLTPYYLRETAAGTLSDEEATFHLACLLLRDTAYLQLGGPDASGRDVTNQVSFLVLEAAHRLKIPANVAIAVGEKVDPLLLRRGVEIMLADRTGIPKFLGVERTAEGFARAGYSLALGRERVYAGCHWLGLPGREYTLNDCVKMSFGPPLVMALEEMMADKSVTPSVAELYRRFQAHMKIAADAIKASLDFHLERQQHNFPELVMDLLCHGPVEKGDDASHKGVEFYNMCCDGVALGTVADSFAALEQRIEREGKLTWEQVWRHLQSDWAEGEGEKTRLMMRSVARYGSGGSLADEWAVRIARYFTDLVIATPTPGGVKVIPGLFSWASTIGFGQSLPATANGRKKGSPVTHGPNPEAGFRRDGAASALAVAVAKVQCGYGNTAPMQIELDMGAASGPEAADNVCHLISTHFKLGGTQINMNIMDQAKVLEAHEDPSKYPDLVVRVTGFSAYFASLSKPFRQLIVDRIISEG